MPTTETTTQAPSASSSLHNEIERLLFIDGLRFLAIFNVVLIHAWTWTAMPDSVVATIINRGALVEFLFVLSGFGLFLPMVRDRSVVVRKLDLKRYVQRRFARIYPPYLVGLALSMLILYAAYQFGFESNHCHFKDIYPWRSENWLNVLAHLTLLHGLFPDFIRSINGTYWVLSLECQFYMLFPILMYVANKYSLRAALILPFVVTFAVRLIERVVFHSNLGTWSGGNMFCLARWTGFGCGMIAAAIIANKIKLPQIINSSGRILACALALSAVACYCEYYQLLCFVKPTLWAACAGFWFVYLGLYDSPLKRVLSLPAITAVGRISYSWYIVHWGVLVVASLLAIKFALGSWVVQFVAPVLTLPVAYVFFRLFELPFSGDKAKLKILKEFEAAQRQKSEAARAQKSESVQEREIESARGPKSDSSRELVGSGQSR